ncbi:hypothetical protein LTR53_002779 [Teratosphaeriaceae sp. CCFEE 6253]|nr:hypothetical protein LTR53_002779 [Teratosphaeriaceae sp. CCFEE 6253]
MATPRRQILTATFGPYVKLYPAVIASYGGEEKIAAMIQASIQQANDAGFDVDNFAVNPADPGDSIQRLEDKLRSRHFDGLLIGWGIRGNQEYTPLFEAVVHAAKEVTPRTKMLFGNAPDDLYNTLQRNFAITESTAAA